MDIPAKAVGDFANEYFSLFASDLDRPDKVGWFRRLRQL
jgi:hypothetical protein